jgi:Ca2+-transporting ATPase
MQQPPRDPDETVLTRGHWWGIAGYGALITVCVLGALALARYGLEFEKERAVTVSFLTLAFVQLWHVFNVRNVRAHWWHNEVVRNRWVWGALVLCTGLLLCAVYLPGLSTVMETVDPGVWGWAIVLGMSLIPLAVGQGIKIARSLSNR